ncbi:MAG TPA: hypothetical protein VHC91_01230 [Trinickia sp.]|jgi:hypothetical protein|uniref:hypothetical protein n=1 Tax=Trinickia sp. TaxID=2571163 RepID=UPI002BEF9405|nr:hypothetical protein [Trinickia sp.]HVW49017.1 hypothetical protein [Trinickia sp.]
MRTTKAGYFSSYWPVALAAALVVLAALRAYGDGSAAREPLAADRVTAELARTVSYGLIDAGTARTASGVHRSDVRAAAAEAS